ncbi:Hypothetical Protein FCC1311_022762 [Hondaea fermentalgiana]|uniref:Uncharacterized protein n=1 Tax=Hondaea fermentalgiana TaxID=2315210 RepID=A0A2R5G4V9_9STRA|nr:Hypothetical Protein FCC1311_022762 [Hondaea fermentalgiana]|eukprot:GBG26056.1 Hypothetical Protein FCC1311_022762 [Hondaea fermentalgiana]
MQASRSLETGGDEGSSSRTSSRSSATSAFGTAASSRSRSSSKGARAAGELMINVGLDEDDLEGSLPSRKAKSSSRAKLSKSKRESRSSGSLTRTGSGSGSGRIRRRAGRDRRKRGPASVGLAALVLIETLRLAVVAIVAIAKGKKARGAAWADLRNWVYDGASSARADPKHAIKMLVYTIAILGVFVLGLQLMGFDVGGGLVPFGRGAGPEGELVTLGTVEGASSPSNGAGANDGSDADFEDPAIVDPSGGQTVEKKKLSKKEEVAFACKEVECVERCVRKSTKKCLQSEGCIKQRVYACKKKCRKSRCESRCKVEPATGYVEREMKTDKCKEDCSMNNKCIEKCEREGKPCKARCGERRKKFTCDRQAEIPWPNAQAAVSAAEIPDDEDADDAGLDEDDDAGSAGFAADDATGAGGGDESAGGGGGDDDDDDEI